MRLSYEPEYKGLINSIRRKAQRYKVQMRFGVGPLVHTDENDTEGSCGYFWGKDGRKPAELAIALGNPFSRWILILIHESCHMDQEYDKKISQQTKDRWNNDMTAFVEWQQGLKQCNKAQVLKYMESTIDCELDCEKRSVEKIIKWNLPLDTRDYIQKANTYLFGHVLVAQRRKWYNNIYNVKTVYNLAPKFFVEDYTKVPKDLMTAFNYKADELDIEENVEEQSKQLVSSLRA